jgi:glucokinase
MDLYVGVDLGGTHFRVGVRVPGEDRLRDQEMIRADPTWDSGGILGAMASLLASLSERLGETVCPVGIGFASTGDIDPDAGVCYSMKRFVNLEAAPLASRLEERFGCPSRLLNDGLAAALGELRAGAGAGVRDFLMLTVGTGIGGGVVMDGQVLTGRGGRIGKAGHQIIDVDRAGPIHCHCGLPGCWQGLAGRDGMTALARSEAAADPSSHLAAAVNEEGFDLETVTRLALEGDDAARRVVETVGGYLGVGIANLVKLFAPQVVLVGGGIAERNPLLLRAIQERADAYAIKPYQGVPVRPAALGKDAGLVGATFLTELDTPR